MRATVGGADYDAFEAPRNPWRIDSGVNAVVA